jgi:hypothetical protein
MKIDGLSEKQKKLRGDPTTLRIASLLSTGSAPNRNSLY